MNVAFYASTYFLMRDKSASSPGKIPLLNEICEIPLPDELSEATSFIKSGKGNPLFYN